MPQGETMFKFHGYSGPCPRPPLLKPHQQRVVEEYEQLFDRTVKLSHFLNTPLFAKLDDAEKSRLNRQWQVMQEYGLILSARIDAFKLENQQ